MTDEHNAASVLAGPSAEVVVPLVLELLPEVTTVVDVGCGTGSWLAAFASYGCSVRGVDRPGLDRSTLVIDERLFQAHDLTRPIEMEMRFDLAISLETAEHLPASAASTFVGGLVSLSDRVLFSAAIPGQGGPSHVNEQWPAYWMREFEQHGYGVSDCLRPQLWLDDRVAWWYRQNLMLFMSNDRFSESERLSRTQGGALPLVHPRAFERLLSRATPSVSDVPDIVRRSFRSRLGR